MSETEFAKHLESATAIVSSWPPWKQNILGRLNAYSMLSSRWERGVREGYGYAKHPDAPCHKNAKVYLREEFGNSY